MNALPRLVRVAALLTAVAPSLALAHPGHDDPDFTWELSHLESHPLATIACFLVLAASLWTCWRWLRRDADENDQSLRKSTVKRGK